MKKKSTLALEFAKNMNGKLSPEIKARLQALIDHPNQLTWNDTFSLILNHRGKVSTLWQAVLAVNPCFSRSKCCEEEWQQIPTQETIIKAINHAVFNQPVQEKVLSNDAYQALKLKKYCADNFNINNI
jgi:hypothetical protein